MASEPHGHPDYTPPGPVDWRALRERRRRQAHDEAIAQWERISPEFARRRAARAAPTKASKPPGTWRGPGRARGRRKCAQRHVRI